MIYGWIQVDDWVRKKTGLGGLSCNVSNWSGRANEIKIKSKRKRNTVVYMCATGYVWFFFMCIDEWGSPGPVQIFTCLRRTPPPVPRLFKAGSLPRCVIQESRTARGPLWFPPSPSFSTPAGSSPLKNEGGQASPPRPALPPSRKRVAKPAAHSFFPSFTSLPHAVDHRQHTRGV